MPTFPNPYTTPSGYVLGGQPTSGRGAFGMVPSQINAPNPFADISSVYPNLSGTNKATSEALLSGLQGQLSAGTQKMIQDAAAAWGVGSGMPGSGLARNKSLRDLGLTSEAVQQKALSQYPGIMGAISATQTVNPALQAEIASLNAKLAAAPDPAAAANYAQKLFKDYLNKTRAGGGGGGIALGGGGPRDALGFPLADQNWLTNLGGPAEVAYGSLGWPGGAQSGSFSWSDLDGGGISSEGGTSPVYAGFDSTAQGYPGYTPEPPFSWGSISATPPQPQGPQDLTQYITPQGFM